MRKKQVPDLKRMIMGKLDKFENVDMLPQFSQEASTSRTRTVRGFYRDLSVAKIIAEKAAKTAHNKNALVFPIVRHQFPAWWSVMLSAAPILHGVSEGADLTSHPSLPCREPRLKVDRANLAVSLSWTRKHYERVRQYLLTLDGDSKNACRVSMG